MKKLKKIFKVIFVFALMIGLGACEKEQTNKAIIVADANNDVLEANGHYGVDSTLVTINIHNSNPTSTYVLIRSIGQAKGDINEDLIELDPQEQRSYNLEDVTEDERTYSFFTDLVIDGEEAKPIEGATAQKAFHLKEYSDEEKQAMNEAQEEKEEESARRKKENHAIGLFLLYVTRNSDVKLKTFSGNFNVASHKLGDSTPYIVTYKDKNNPRIKLIFDWDGDTSKDLEDTSFDPWYYLENGDEKFNELDAKREKALNNQ